MPSKLRLFLSRCVYFSFLAGNESCPQPQTSEHLAAIEIMKLKHMIILQNKIDLVKETQAKEQYEQILGFVKGIFLLLEINLTIYLFFFFCIVYVLNYNLFKFCSCTS